MSAWGTVLLAVLGVLAAAVGGLGTYLVSRRRSSGKISTTEAGELWKANQAFQSALTVEVDKLREQFAACQARNTELQVRVLKLESEADAALIIAEARLEADRIRARAKVADEALKQEAQVVKEALDRKEDERG